MPSSLSWLSQPRLRAHIHVEIIIRAAFALDGTVVLCVAGKRKWRAETPLREKWPPHPASSTLSDSPRARLSQKEGVSASRTARLSALHVLEASSGFMPAALEELLSPDPVQHRKLQGWAIRTSCTCNRTHRMQRAIFFFSCTSYHTKRQKEARPAGFCWTRKPTRRHKRRRALLERKRSKPTSRREQLPASAIVHLDDCILTHALSDSQQLPILPRIISTWSPDAPCVRFKGGQSLSHRSSPVAGGARPSVSLAAPASCSCWLISCSLSPTAQISE